MDIKSSFRSVLLDEIRLSLALFPDERITQILSNSLYILNNDQCRLINVSDSGLFYGMARRITLNYEHRIESGNNTSKTATNCDDTEVRYQIIDKVENYLKQNGQMRVGYVLFCFASWSGMRKPWLLYDIEDGDILKGSDSLSDDLSFPDLSEYPAYDWRTPQGLI